MIDAPQSLVHALEGWARLYGDTKLISTGLSFVHFAGLLLGGGAAVAADRATLRAANESEPVRADHLAFLGSVHAIAIAGLLTLFASGVLIFLADLETFWGSRIFWTKMGLILVLVVNALMMRRAERLALAAPGRAWRILKTSSIASLALWFVILLMSTVLATTA